MPSPATPTTSPIPPTLPAEDKIARLDAMEDVLLGRRDAGSPSALRLRAQPGRDGRDAASFADLLIAFRRDATKLRYADWDELYDYCRYSAMPVGRHVLDLHGEDRATYVAVRCAVHVAAGAEPSAGLREGSGRRWIAAICRWTCWRDAARRSTICAARRNAGLRRVFDLLLDQVDALNRAAVELPRRHAKPAAAAGDGGDRRPGASAGATAAPR